MISSKKFKEIFLQARLIGVAGCSTAFSDAVAEILIELLDRREQAEREAKRKQTELKEKNHDK